MPVRRFDGGSWLESPLSKRRLDLSQFATERAAALKQFYRRWEEDPLVIDKWFALQARSALPGTIAAVRAHTSHEAEAAADHSRAPRGSSPRRHAPDSQSATRSRAVSRHGCGGAPSDAVGASRAGEPADDPQRPASRMPESTRAPACRTTLLRASERTSSCGGDPSRLTSLESAGLLSTCCNQMFARAPKCNLHGG